MHLDEVGFRCLVFPAGDTDAMARVLDCVSAHEFERLMAISHAVATRAPHSYASKAISAIVDVLFDDAIERHPVALRDPLFIVCLSRLERAVGRYDDVEIEQLARLFVWAVLPALIDAIGIAGLKFEVTIPSSCWLSIPQSGYRIRAIGSSQTGRLDFLTFGVHVLVGSDIVLRLRRDRHGDRILIERSAAAPLEIEQRPVLDSAHELYDLSELPEVLGGSPLTSWVTAGTGPEVQEKVRHSLSLLRNIWPNGSDDVTTFGRVLVSLDTASGTPGSICCPVAPFVVGLSFARCDALSIAELLLHEVAHIKIDIAQIFDPIVLDLGHAVHRHPWRDDLRTITGVLYAAHAFLTTLALYRKAYQDPRLRKTIARDLSMLERDIGTTLAYLTKVGSFTPKGKFFVHELCTVFHSISQSHPTEGSQCSLA